MSGINQNRIFINFLYLLRGYIINIQKGEFMKILFSVCAFLLTVSLFSANLVNKDSKKYDIEVKTVGTTHTSINGSTTQMGGAPDGAEIKIKDTGSKIKVSGSKDVVIKDGKLSQ